MKKHIALFTCFSLLSISILAGTWYAAGSDSPLPVQHTLIQTTDQSIILKFNVQGFFLYPVETPRGIEHIVSVPGMVQISEAATPDLPWYGVSAIIPDLALMKFRVLSSSYTDFEGIEIAPSRGHILRSDDPSTIPFTYGDIYNQDEFYPFVRGQLQEAFILRDYRGQVVNILPFAYNPVSKTLRVYTELEIELYNDGVGGENKFHRDRMPEKMAREFGSIYEQTFINYQQNRYQILQEEGNLLIIAHSPFMEAMEPLVEWKKTIGRPTELVDVSTIGSTTAAIKAFILNYYNTNGLTHLLLVGDHQHIPSQPMSGGYSDNFYGYLFGTDSYNEVFVGRFSAESVAHVQTQVQRTIHYEKDINEADTWLNKGIGIARNEGTGMGHYGENDYVHMNFIRDSLLNYTYSQVLQLYDGNVPGIPNTNASQMLQRINEGTSIINFCNHGSMTGWSVGGFNISHVNALTNTNKLPFIWSVACDNGRFTSGTCFAEVWMRATHNSTGEPTGAIATMMSWISQPWQPPMTGQDEMVTILVEQRDHIKRTMGGVSINGSARMITQHGSSGRNTHDTWILFGDPTLTLRTDVPTPVEAIYNPALYMGTSEFTLDANAEGAIVALTMNGEILGTAYVENGTTTLQFPAISEPGIVSLAIFGKNHVTYLQDLEVLTEITAGDSDCDGNVNVLDAITTVNYVMGDNPQPFCFQNADTITDGIIDILDLIATVNIILRSI
jgi:hypothetical protein